MTGGDRSSDTIDQYPAELITPPLALVALLGSPDLHAPLGEFLRSHHKPPINSVGVADPQAVGRLFGERKSSLIASHAPPGILKADWFAKHRQRRPAVAVLLLARKEVEGAPDAWQRVSAAVAATRAATRAQGARIVLVIASMGVSAGEGAVAEERVSALCRQGGLERRWVATLSTSEGEAGLKRIGRLLYEAAGQFYLDDSKRRLTLHGERRNPPPDLNARTAFKAAALSEFRADWSTAVRTYETAYRELARVAPTPAMPLQRFVELAAVAEMVHLKVVMLLLHQQNTQRALAAFKEHMRLFKAVPMQAVPPEFQAAHWGWVARQYAVMADMLSKRVPPETDLPPEKDAQPAYFQMGAAQAAIQRRKLVQELHAASQHSPPGPDLGGTVAPGVFVGQLLLTQAGRQPRRMSDAEFLAHLEAMELAADASGEALVQLRKAQAFVFDARERTHIATLIGQELLLTSSFSAALPLLQEVAGAYRRDRWQVPLAGIVQDLRACAQALSLPKEVTAAALELAVLSGAPLSAEQRSGFASEAAAALAGASGSDMAFSIGARSDDCLAGCFALTGGFDSRLAAGAAAAEGGSARFALALWSNMPASLPVASLQVTFSTKRGQHTATAECRALDGTPLRSPPALDAWAAESAPDESSASRGFVLDSRRWLVGFAQPPTSPDGKVSVHEITLRFANGASISWPASGISPDAPMRGAVAEGMDAILSPFARLPHHEHIRLGQMDLQLLPAQLPPELRVEALGYAMAGEQVPIDLVVSASHGASDVFLTLSCRYREGTTQPQLTLEDDLTSDDDVIAESPSAAQASPLSPSAPDPASNSDAARESQPGTIERIPVGSKLAAKTSKRLRAWMVVLSRGQVAVSAQLTARSDEDDVMTANASLEVTVERPFTLDVHITAPPRTDALLLAAVSHNPFMSAEELAAAQQVQTLPTGQACLLAADISATAPAAVLISGVALERASSGDVGAAVQLLQSVAGTQPSAGLPLSKSDVHSALFLIQASAPAASAEIGDLIVTWKRQKPARRRASSSMLPARSQGAGTQILELPEASAGPPEPPPHPVTTRLPLPKASFAHPAIVVSSSWPATIQAGEAFALTVHISNKRLALQRLQLAVGDTSGFVFAGDRKRQLVLGPRAEASVTLQVVAHATGSLPMPQIRLTAPAYEAGVDVCHARRIFVVPSPLHSSSTAPRPSAPSPQSSRQSQAIAAG